MGRLPRLRRSPDDPGPPVDRPRGGERVAREQALQRLLGRRSPIVIAHRGASDLAPENTMTAFRLALDAGADALETDLWLTSDHEIVCHHDATLERMAGDPRRVVDLTSSELRKVAIGDPATGDGVPTLQALLDFTPPDVYLVLELKDPRLARGPGLERLGELLAQRLQQQTAAVVSFHGSVLARVRRGLPTAATGHITLANPWPRQPDLLLGPFWPLLLVNPFYVAVAHRRRRIVTPLDPNLHRRLRWYVRLGVDGLLTNDPAETRRRLDAER